MIACCGLNCSECDAYIATRANDNNKRIEVAKNWSEQFKEDIKPEDINCNGCGSEEQKFSYCNACEIRKCCMDKDLANCAGCNMYSACDKLKIFFVNAPEARTTLDKLHA